jgi:hypothetical protein
VNLQSILLLAVIVGLVVLALRSHKKHGSCGCDSGKDCTSCPCCQRKEQSPPQDSK